MDSKAYSAGLAKLREVRDQIKPLERQLAKLHTEREKRVIELGAYEKAKADRIATAAGVSVIDVVALAPSLGPQEPASAPVEPSPTDSAPDDHPEPQAPAQAIKEAAGAPAPDLQRQDVESGDRAAALDRLREAVADGAFDLEVLDEPAAAPLPAQPTGEQERTLPSIPEGAAGDRWIYAEPNLTSKRPNFKQATRQMAFLDTATGVLVWQAGTVTLNLGRASVAEILTAVYATVPADVERIYITAGDPWHQNAGRHQFLKDAVAEWLNGPLPEGWQVESSRGKDRQAGHLVHPRNPVGRWQRGKDQHTEIRSVGEWFDPAGTDPATVRAAFVELWKALRRHWDDVVLMGSPSQTGRDLWSRTIPAKAGAK